MAVEARGEPYLAKRPLAACTARYRALPKGSILSGSSLGLHDGIPHSAANLTSLASPGKFVGKMLNSLSVIMREKISPLPSMWSMNSSSSIRCRFDDKLARLLALPI